MFPKQLSSRNGWKTRAAWLLHDHLAPSCPAGRCCGLRTSVMQMRHLGIHWRLSTRKEGAKADLEAYCEPVVF